MLLSAAGKRHEQAPVVFEAAHESDKDGSQESGGQDQVEEQEEDHVEEEVATSSGRGQAGAAPQGPSGGPPAGDRPTSCCNIKPQTVLSTIGRCIMQNSSQP